MGREGVESYGGECQKGEDNVKIFEEKRQDFKN